MTEFPIIIVVTVLLFIYGTFSKKLVSGPISPPLFFCFIGIFFFYLNLPKMDLTQK